MSKKRKAQLSGGHPVYSTLATGERKKDSKAKGTRTGMMRRSTLAKVGKQKAKRQARNAEYYRSAEWRAKRKAVFERDGYQCVEILRTLISGSRDDTTGSIHFDHTAMRCPNRGEIVNGKQTARGLVAEERGYQHRGTEGAIDRIVTRCRECDRRLTPLERVNHASGFNGARRTSPAIA